MREATILAEELVEIRDYVNRAFGEDIAQEVAVRLLERSLRSDLSAVRGWGGYGFIIARHLLWRQTEEDEIKSSLDTDTDIHVFRDEQHPDLTHWTAIGDPTLCQLIAREDCRRLMQSEHTTKVVRYALFGERKFSRQYIERLRKKLRKMLEE